MNRNKRNNMKIKEIIVFAGNKMEVFEFSIDEKLICTKNEIKAKTKNMFNNIQAYKKKIYEQQNQQKQNISIIDEKIETESNNTNKILNKLSDLISNDGEIFVDFEPNELMFKDTHDKYNNIF